MRHRQLEALKRGDLEAAASVSGEFVSEIGYPKTGGPASIEELNLLSKAVVIARAEDNECSLSGDRRTINTYFRLRVESTLRGEMASGDLVTMVVRGGKVVFANGSSATMDTANFRLPETGQRVLVFLRSAEPELIKGKEALLTSTAGKAYVPAAAPLGLFALDLASSKRLYVLPAGRFDNPLSRSLYHSRLSPEAFVGLVAKTIGRR